VFPVWFVFQLIRRKSWSLMVTMLLPLLFVVPYMVLHFDLGYSKHSWSLLNQLGMPVFVGRICNSLYVLPAIAFCCFCVRSLWLGLWRLLAFAALFVILYGVLRGALQVLFESFTMSEGSHYQWWDWSHIILLQHGVGFVGMWVIAYMIFKQFGVKIWSRNTPVGNLLKSQLLKSQQ